MIIIYLVNRMYSILLKDEKDNQSNYFLMNKKQYIDFSIVMLAIKTKFKQEKSGQVFSSIEYAHAD